MLEFFAFIGQITCVVIALVAILHICGIIRFKTQIINDEEVS